jgi:hypothetical protein
MDGTDMVLCPKADFGIEPSQDLLPVLLLLLLLLLLLTQDMVLWQAVNQKNPSYGI